MSIRLAIRGLCLAASVVLLMREGGQDACAAVAWTSSNQFRILLAVDAKGRKRSNSPVAVEFDFQKALTERRAGNFDGETVEVIPFSPHGIGSPRRVPHRIEKFFGSTIVRLHFVLPNESRTNLAVYFDTRESRRGDPKRYHGLVGDGDYFCEGFGRREIGPSHFDCFVDFDGDGDLDLFKGGVEPFVYCYENVGANRFVERGRLTSAGKVFKLPCSKSNRSWVTVAFYDIDGDGDQDFFPSFGDGPDAGQIIFYRNTTREHAGELTFERVGPLRTVFGTPLAGGAQAGGWFPSITFIKGWNGAGPDALVGSNNRGWLYRNLGTNADGSPKFAEATALQAGGKEIVLSTPRFDCADVDGDGDLDLFAATQPGPVWFFKNIGSREKPELATGEIVAWNGRYLIADAHSGIKVADFDNDGLPDIVSGRFWERADLNAPDTPQDFGGFWKNAGTRDAPRWSRSATGGPFTEQFQICDAVRQNCVRAVDWDGDGTLDLLAGDTDGFIWFFRNKGDGGAFPVFDSGKRIREGNLPFSVAATGGHARFDVCDWNNDGIKDLLVADGSGGVTLLLNRGNKSKPAFTAREQLKAGGKPLQIGPRASVLVCDWNNDGRKDLVLADEKRFYVYRNSGTDAAPQLEAPQPIQFNGKPAGYVRPNLGCFVDWDGDGKRDLIGCQFENSVRLYRNIGSGGKGADPLFADPEGVVLLQGESPQMISGAEVVDWNGDGDLDLLTGQGHGGSGLRFYEHDWIEDELHNTHPTARIVGIETKPVN